MDNYFPEPTKNVNCNDILIRQKRMSRTFPKQETIPGKENSIGKTWTLDNCERLLGSKCLEQLDIGHVFFQEMRLEMWVGTRLALLCWMA